jgi:hypothetical protein
VLLFLLLRLCLNKGNMTVARTRAHSRRWVQGDGSYGTPRPSATETARRAPTRENKPCDCHGWTLAPAAMPRLPHRPTRQALQGSGVGGTECRCCLLLLYVVKAASIAPGAPTAEKVEALGFPAPAAPPARRRLVVPKAALGAAIARAVLKVLAHGGGRHLALRWAKGDGGVSRS